MSYQQFPARTGVVCLLLVSAFAVNLHAADMPATDRNLESKMSEKTTVHVVPQSHIDVVWLWRFDPETIHRCCKPTFTRATDNLDQFPEYTFSASQVPLYEATERHYPALFEKMRKYINEGRWEIVGGMYVEFEGGEPGGEALVRQCVMGKRYWKSKFGVDVTTGWQQDAWSHPWQLPQILSKCGINSYMFLRGEKGEKLFWWQAPDGSKVLAVRPFFMDFPPYKDLPKAIETIREKYGLHDVMIKTGGGDHGGGLTADHIKLVLDVAKKSAPDTEVKFDTFSRYVKTILDQKPQLPTLDDELGFQLEGDLTGCCEIKKSNRECENLLLTAEKWAAIAFSQFKHEYPGVELEDAWKKLLFNQFHDVLGGSAIPPAVKDVMQDYLSIRESCDVITKDALKAIVHNIDTAKVGGESFPADKDHTALVVFNSLSWKRTGPVEFELEFKEAPKNLSMKDAEGHDVPLQILERRIEEKNQFIRAVFVAKDVPSIGYKTYRVLRSDATEIFNQEQASVLENEFYKVEIDPDTGYLSSTFDKTNQREVLASGAKGNVLIAIDDEGDSEGRFILGQDLAPFPPGEARAIMTKPSISLIEKSPVRDVVRVERPFQHSHFVQEICLYHGIPRVDFRLTIDWHDTEKMIKLAFPFAVENPEVTYDGPYAAIVRPADGNEYPAQKWIDVYSKTRGCNPLSNGYGVALLNNGRYAHDVKENTVRMSILRSPTHPAYNVEEGAHTLDYAIVAHKGPWQESHVMRQGYDFNFPIMAVATPSHEGDLPAEHSFFSVEPENVVLEVVKKAYDSDDLVLRFCETNGLTGSAKITAPTSVSKASEIDLLESSAQAIKTNEKNIHLPIAAHEIKTIRVGFDPTTSAQ